jgi:WXXGXW repeat (2 copies)
MPNRLLIIAIASLATLLGACTAVVREPAQPPRVVYRDPPPPVVEVRPPPPAVGYNWVPGHYVWREGAWRWDGGHYVQVAVRPMPPLIVEEVSMAPSTHHAYVRGHWRWGGNDWVWVHGTWVAG